MHFIVVGAGSVGGVLGSSLERAGHDVRYWARDERPRDDTPFTLERRRGPSLRSRPLQWLSAGQKPVPDSDWVLVCVRTEQLQSTLERVARELGPQRAVAIATVTLDGALAAARAAGLVGRVLALHISFGSRASPDAPRRLQWFPFSAPTLASPEGQAALLPDARALARALREGGLPARAALDVRAVMRLMFIAVNVLSPAWQLCDWDSARLARDRPLRWQTARALHETLRALAPEHGLTRLVARGLPAGVYACVLRVLPLLLGSAARELWHSHGPKITAQTRFIVNELLEVAERKHTPLPHLAQLRQRWESALAAPPSAATKADRN